MEAKKPRVFMVETPRADIDLATVQQFGEIVTVFEPPQRSRSTSTEAAPRHIFRPSVFKCDEFAQRYMEMLDSLGFDPDVDYFIFAGGLIGVALAFAAMSVRYGRVRMLVFNSAMEGYQVKEFNAGKPASAAA